MPTYERTRRPCGNPECPETFRRQVTRGHRGSKRIYCSHACGCRMFYLRRLAKTNPTLYSIEERLGKVPPISKLT